MWQLFMWPLLFARVNEIYWSIFMWKLCNSGHESFSCTRANKSCHIARVIAALYNLVYYNQFNDIWVHLFHTHYLSFLSYIKNQEELTVSKPCIQTIHRKSLVFMNIFLKKDRFLFAESIDFKAKRHRGNIQWISNIWISF